MKRKSSYKLVRRQPVILSDCIRMIDQASALAMECRGRSDDDLQICLFPLVPRGCSQYSTNRIGRATSLPDHAPYILWRNAEFVHNRCFACDLIDLYLSGVVHDRSGNERHKLPQIVGSCPVGARCVHRITFLPANMAHVYCSATDI